MNIALNFENLKLQEITSSENASNQDNIQIYDGDKIGSSNTVIFAIYYKRRINDKKYHRENAKIIVTE